MRSNKGRLPSLFQTSRFSQVLPVVLPVSSGIAVLAPPPTRELLLPLLDFLVKRSLDEGTAHRDCAIGHDLFTFRSLSAPNFVAGRLDQRPRPSLVAQHQTKSKPPGLDPCSAPRALSQWTARTSPGWKRWNLIAAHPRRLTASLTLTRD